MNLTTELATAARDLVDVVAGRRAHLPAESADQLHAAIDAAAPAPEPEPAPAAEPAAVPGLEDFTAEELAAAAEQLRAAVAAEPAPAAELDSTVPDPAEPAEVPQ